MPIWTLLVWLVIGALAGYFAQKIMGGNSPFGLLGDVGFGLAGAVLGGWGLSLLGLSPNSGGIIATFIVALVGALALIWVVRKIKAV